MILLVAKWWVRPGQMDRVLEELGRMAPLVAENEPGCSLYTAHRSRKDPNLILLVERYADEAAITAHRETSYFKEIVEGTIVPLLDSREREFLDVVIG